MDNRRLSFWPRSTERLRVFSWSAHYLIEFVRLSALPFLLVALLSASGALAPLKQLYQNSLALALLTIIGLILNHVAPLRGYAQSLGQWLRRRLYVSLISRYSPTARRFWTGLAEFVVRIPLPRTRLAHRTQEVAVRVITAALQGDVARSLFFIEGESGSGKTSLVPILLDAIIRSPHLAPLAERIFYFDFALEESVQHRFLQEYSTLRFENHVVVIDNFHRLAAALLRQFTRAVVDCQQGCAERALVVLSQPLAKMLTGPDGDIRLLAQVRASGKYIKLEKPGVQDLLDRLTDSSRRQLSAIARPSHEIDPIVNLHYARLLNLSLARRKSSVEDILKLEERSSVSLPSATPLHDELLELLGIITGLSMHRGHFSKGEFRQACFRLGGSWRISCWLLYSRYYRLLKRLTKGGFVLTALMRRRTFVFHELLAIHYKETYNKIDLFHHACCSSIRCLLSRTTIEAAPVLRWLYAVELDDHELIHDCFGAALLHGSFLSLLSTIERNHRPRHDTEFSYEIGLLCEKVGRFDEARRLLNIAVNAIAGTDRARRAQIQLIEAEHGSDSPQILSQIVATTRSHLTSLLARYWLLHLDMHRGVFQLDRLTLLGDELAQDAEELIDDDPYLCLHLARRIFFDMFRVFYLIGSRDTATWRKLNLHSLSELLRLRHPEYAAFYTKFAKAHRIHYDVLFEVGALSRSLTDDPVASGEGVRTSDLPDLIRAADALYVRAIEEFDIFGDKTIGYIHSRRADVEMAKEDCDWRLVRLKLAEYDKFLGVAGFDDMEGYLHAYHGKYHSLRAFWRIAENGATSATQKEFDSEVAQARTAFQRGIDIHVKHANAYGEVRCRLLLGLLNLLALSGDEGAIAELSALGERALGSGYIREADLLLRITAPGGVSVADLVNIIRFYPIIHQ